MNSGYSAIILTIFIIGWLLAQAGFTFIIGGFVFTTDPIARYGLVTSVTAVTAWLVASVTAVTSFFTGFTSSLRA